MISEKKACPFYAESPSGEFYTSPFFFSRLAAVSLKTPVTKKLPPSKKSLIGEKSPSYHLIGARWHDPELGMFLSPDPMRQFFNPYSYGAGNPINGMDPSGRWFNPFDGDDWKWLGDKISDGWDATYRETNQTLSDFDRWAGGYGEGDDEYVLRYLYRGAIHGSAEWNCGNDWGCTEYDRIAQDSKLGGGYGSDGWYVDVGTHNPAIGPGSEMGRQAKARKNAEASNDDAVGSINQYVAVQKSLQDPCGSGPCIYSSNEYPTLHMFVNSPQFDVLWFAATLSFGGPEIKLTTEAVSAARGASLLRVGEFSYTKTVANHALDVVKKGEFAGQLSRPYMNSPSLINEILATGKGVKDPGGLVNALRYDVPGVFRGSKGTWQLVVNPSSKTIYHFNFVGY